MDFDELLDDFDDDDEVSEDRTLFKRELPNGQERTDFEVIERTVFGGAYPATTKEMRQKSASGVRAFGFQAEPCCRLLPRSSFWLHVHEAQMRP